MRYHSEAGGTVAATNFDEFLDANEPGSPGDVLALYDAVVTSGDWGSYASTHDGEGRVFVKGWTGTQLALVSERAISAFLRRVSERYALGMEIETWAEFEFAISKDD